ncbi:MAG: PAS domain S-box protein [Desulfobacula sp.]|nr:PAS domain S-box protein [Desulfobacula sp.]
MGLVITIILVSTISIIIAHKVAQKKAREHLNTKADEYLLHLKDILILPIWNYDYETIDAIGQTYLQNEQIAGIIIVDSRGNTCISVVKPDTTPLVVRSAKLSHYGLPMGFVEISLTSSYYNIWNRQLFWYFGLIILINLLSLLIMTGSLLRWSLNKPLNLLNRIVKSYASKKDISIHENMPYSEFMPLVDTLEDMGNEIKFQMSELIKTEKNYRSIFENATEGIFQSTLQGKVINANPAFAKILGYKDPEELISKVHNISVQHYVHPEQRDEYLKILKKNKVVNSYEVQFKKKDNSIIWVSLNALSIYDSHGDLRHIEGLVQDITERKKAETELQRLSTAVEQVAENIIITDAKGKIKYVNPAFERSTGYTLKEVYNFDHRFFGADETEKTIYDEVLSTVEKDRVWTGRLTNRKKNNAVVIEDAIISPIKSPLGRFMGYVSINRDVTLKAKFENQLRQSHKMEAIGTLAGGIAHDFNNILGVIIGCSELARNSISKDHRAVKDIEQVLTASLRAKALVSQILAFSRQEAGKKIPLSLSPFIKEVVKFLTATLPKIIEIRVTLNTDSGIVLADPIQMQQILMNLCTNSSQAIGRNRGIIDVTLSNMDYQKRDNLPPEIKPGSYVLLEVRDNGCGISEEIMHKIFDPFFTTKSIGEGTGLGLSVVHGIVKKHEGTVTVKSSVGAGTNFCIILPRLEHADITINVEPSLELPQGKERIMLVDDETALLDILERILSNLGYDVHAYPSSFKAMEAFKLEPGYFDLIVTDQLMPDMTGTDLISGIKNLNQDIPIILVTGFNEKKIEQKDYKRLGFNRLLVKPLRNADLVFAIRKELDDNRKQKRDSIQL